MFKFETFLKNKMTCFFFPLGFGPKHDSHHENEKLGTFLVFLCFLLAVAVACRCSSAPMAR